MLLREFVRGTYVADVNICLVPRTFQTIIELLGTRAIYIAPSSYYDEWYPIIDKLESGAEIHPFGGGFKENSLVLFSLNSAVDRKFFEKITEFQLNS
jgi:hypothetical protein